MQDHSPVTFIKGKSPSIIMSNESNIEFDTLLQQCVDVKLKIEELSKKKDTLTRELGPIGAVQASTENTATQLLNTLYEIWKHQEELKLKTKKLEDMVCEKASTIPTEFVDNQLNKGSEYKSESLGTVIQNSRHVPKQNTCSKRVQLSKIPRRRTKSLRPNPSLNWQLNLVEQILMGNLSENKPKDV